MAFKKYDISITGVSPLIWNRMKKELEDEKAKLKKDQLSEWEEKNWVRKAELGANGDILLPPEWVKWSIIESAKKSRIVPHYANSKNQTYTFYAQSMMVEVPKPICNRKDLQYFGQYVGARGKNSSSKVWRVRPLLKEGWKTRFILTDPEGRMKKSELETLLNFAGFMVGIGDNRINNFGRFEVNAIKELN